MQKFIERTELVVDLFTFVCFFERPWSAVIPEYPEFWDHVVIAIQKVIDGFEM